MSLNSLVKTTKRTQKRVGRGPGSGKGGHTVGRGKYGQKTRENIPLLFQGSKFRKTLIKRLPLLRGKGKFKSHRAGCLIVNLKYLNLFAKDETVDMESLAKKGIINLQEGKLLGVKILGEGELTVPLIIKLPISHGARKKVEKAGGKVEENKEEKKPVLPEEKSRQPEVKTKDKRVKPKKAQG